MADRNQEGSATAVAMRAARRCRSGPVADCRSGPPCCSRRTSRPMRRASVFVATNRRIVRWQQRRNAAQKSPDPRRRYRVRPVEKQTPSCPGLHKMWSWDGRSAQHRPPGRGTGIDRVRVPELRLRDQRAHSSRGRPIAEFLSSTRADFGNFHWRPPSSSAPQPQGLGDHGAYVDGKGGRAWRQRQPHPPRVDVGRDVFPTGLPSFPARPFGGLYGQQLTERSGHTSGLFRD
jgi:hypothetical protein